MKKWEDSIKERLDGYESQLPEGSLAEFRALREGKKAESARKAAPWIWGLTVAVAAGLATVLLLRQQETPVDGIQIIEHPTTPVAAIIDSSDVTGQLPSAALIAQAVTPRAVHQVSIRTREVIPNDESEATVEAASDEEDVASVQAAEASADSARTDSNDGTAGETTDPSEERTASPFIPENAEPRTPMALKVAPAAGVIAGSGLLAAVLMPVLKTGTMDEIASSSDQIAPYEYGIGTGYTTGDQPSDVPRHAFPLRLGLSARIPLADRLYLSTGLQYSLYSSSFTYRFSGELKQKVHYVGVPVRIDWVFASGKWLDVYVGGGVQGDFCAGATWGGQAVSKDGPSLSLMGAGGVQMNITRRLGLYAEPELSWRIPSEKHVLQTYRSEHPLMFSVNAGIRINIGEKK